MNKEIHYRRPWYLFNRHLESAVPYWQYKIYEIPYDRERLELADGDFLDLDWIRSNSSKLIVMSHAMEGNSRDYFVERAAKYFSKKGYDILMWHFRGCSREMNRLPRFYHLGNSDDLQAVIQHGAGSGYYQKIFLVGFSMGGVTTLNYLHREKVHPLIAASIVFSTPLDLAESGKRISSGIERVYGQWFLRKWKTRIRRKAEQYPELFDLTRLEKTRTLEELHSKYTLHLHGFDSIDELYFQFSPMSFLDQFNHPTLIVNAKNDPVLGPNSYTKSTSKPVETWVPRHGGHLGFSLPGKSYSWMEMVAEHYFQRYS